MACIPTLRTPPHEHAFSADGSLLLNTYLEVSEAAGRAFFSRPITGSITMLNLLRFREVADYSATPALVPAVASAIGTAPPSATPLSGEAAYLLYMDQTLPHLAASGGELLFYGRGGPWLIGPPGEYWDAAMLVRQSSLQSFLAFASNPAYLEVMAHRTAALADSRLLPLLPDSVVAALMP